MGSRLHVLLGTDKGKVFDLESDKVHTLGRSSDNDIQIKDKNISRHHLKIQCKNNKYFIEDLNSKNGTFISGRDITPGIEVEVDEKNPIVVGMNVIGLGEGCGSWIKNFLETVDGRSKTDEKDEISKSYGVMEIKKNIGFIYKMNNILTESKDINEISQKMVGCIVNLFKGVDRCAIILVDAVTKKISNVIYQSKIPLGDPSKAYNSELVEHALILNKSVMISDSYDEFEGDGETTKSLQLKNIRSAICVPMNSPRHKRGAIYIDSLEKSYRFLKKDIFLLEDISSRVALTMDYLSFDEKLT